MYASRGIMNGRCACRRPTPDTRASRTMASARKPIELSWRRSQWTAVATPRSTNAIATASCRKATSSVTSGRTAGGQGRHIGKEGIDHPGIPLPARARAQRGQRLVEAPARTVGAIVDQRIEGVADRDDPRPLGNGPAREPVRVPRPVPALVVIADDREQPGAGAQRRHDGLADERMQVHRDLFVVVQGTGLEEDGVGDADLADVVDETAAE